MSRRMHLVAVCVLAPLFGCGTPGTAVEPDATSYPRESIRNSRIFITPHLPIQAQITLKSQQSSEPVHQSNVARDDRLIYEFDGPKSGDTAEEEKWIAPYYGGSIDEQGRTACNGPFRISVIGYYAGNEATLSMMGISGPALKVKFRCPVYKSASGNILENRLRGFASTLPDQEYFDTLSKSYDITSTEMINVILSVAKTNGISIDKSETSDGFTFIRSTPMAGTSGIHSFAALISSEGNKSSVLFIVPIYKRISNDINPFGNYVCPADRETSYDKGKLFLGMVASNISKK